MGDTRYMSKEFLTDFINMYKNNTCLWKIKSKEYRSKHLKKRAYEELTEFCKKTVPDANRDFVAKKIQNLRAAFRKESNKVKASKRSGVPTEQIYKPSLWYYDLLLFTLDAENEVESADDNFDDFSVSRSIIKIEESAEMENMSNSDVSQDAEYETENVTRQTFRTESERPSTAPKAKIRRTTDSSEDLNAFINVCTETPPRIDKMDEFDAVGVNVAAKLRKMDPHQACLAEALLNKVLFKGTLKTLTLQTKLIEVPEEDANL